MVAFSPDDETVAAASTRDGTIALLDVKTGARLDILAGHDFWITAIAWSPDGEHLASAGRSDAYGDDIHVVIIWDVATSEPVHTFTFDDISDARGLTFNPEGTKLAASYENRVYVWNVKTGEQLGDIKLGKDDDGINLAWSPDGKRIAVAPAGGAVTIWDAERFRKIDKLGSLDWRFTTFVLEWSLDGKTIAASDGDMVYTWDADTGKLKHSFIDGQGYTRTLSFSPDGTQIATGSQDGTLFLWDVETGQQIRSARQNVSAIKGIAWSPRSDKLALASSDGLAYYLDMEYAQQTLPLEYLYNHRPRTLIFNPAGTYLAAIMSDGRVLVWDTQTGERLRTLVGHNNTPQDIVFLPDGESLASVSEKELIVWNANTGEGETLLSDGSFNVARLSPDGSMIATAIDDSHALLWDVTTETELYTLDVPTGPILIFDWSPDGRYVAAALYEPCASDTVVIWEVESGEVVHTLDALGQSSTALVFSSDGTKLAGTFGMAGSAIVWDVDTGKEINRIEGVLEWVWSASWAPDSQMLIVGSWYSEALFWMVE